MGSLIDGAGITGYPFGRKKWAPFLYQTQK